jgi:hypothetical protein
MANGDDGIAWGVSDVDAYLRTARESGFKVRGVGTSLDEFEFCSHWYNKNGLASLTSWKKGVYRILTSPGTTYADAMQFVAETRHNAEYSRLLRYVESLELINTDSPGPASA